MGPRTRIVKIGALLLSQFGLLVALNFHFFGMITAYKMMELKRNLSLAACVSARKTYLPPRDQSDAALPTRIYYTPYVKREILLCSLGRGCSLYSLSVI